MFGRFGGAELADFLDHIGADPTAQFVTVTCADKDKMDKDKMGMAEKHDALHVKSVKMIAATCP